MGRDNQSPFWQDSMLAKARRTARMGFKQMALSIRKVWRKSRAAAIVRRSLAVFALVGGFAAKALGAPLPQQHNGLSFPGFQGAGRSLPLTIVVLLTLLTLLPAILLAMTPFVRLLVVFHFLRQALGTQSTPTNQTFVGLAFFLTCFIMQPVVSEIYTTAVIPLQQGSVGVLEAVDLGSHPLRRFMLKYAREKDLALFVELGKEPRPRTPEDLSMRVVIPAYILSELKAGFQIGTVLFLPFLVIDLVVASVTTSVGMLQLPPVMISTPLKILLFVIVDGWNLVVGSLVKSFY